MDFAKLYKTEDTGQILVVIDEDDDGSPQVAFSFKPKNMGVCSIQIKFKNWDGAEKYFDKIDTDMAMNIIKQQKDDIESLQSEG